jgi:hypothetical protein
LEEASFEAEDAEEGLDVLDALRDVAGAGGGHGMAPPPASATEWLRCAAAGEGLAGAAPPEDLIRDSTDTHTRATQCIVT